MDDEFKRLAKDLGDMIERLGRETGRFIRSACEETEKLFRTDGREIKDRFEAITENIRIEAREIGDAVKRLKNDEEKRQVIRESALKLKRTLKALAAEMVLWPDTNYQDLILRLLLKNAPRGDEEVFICKRDEKRIDGPFIARTNEELKKAGKKGELKLSSRRVDIDGGFILKSDGVEINCSLDALFAEMGKKFEEEVRNIVFGDKK